MSLDTMTKAELVTYAETLGVEVGGRDSADTIKAKIAEVTGEAFNAKAAKSTNPVVDGDLEDEVTVIFNPDGNDNSMVVIGHQGSLMALPRSKPVKIKKKFLSVLKEAITTNYVTQVDPVTNKTSLVAIDRPTYTYQLVSE